jgi:LruC domain-containing protein
MKSNTLKQFAFLFIFIILAGCVKFPQPVDIPSTSELNISKTFDWKTIETKMVSFNTTSSVLNQHGDTIAKNLPAGEYPLYVGKGSILTVVTSNVILEESTKAISTPVSGTKTRIFFPAQNKYATVMFEDLFPFSGDRDMNDIVFGLNIEYDLDNKGRVMAINFNIEPRAIGSTRTFIGLGANFTGMPVEVSKIVRKSLTLPGIINNHSDLSPIYNIDPKSGYFNPVNPSDQVNADYKVAPFTGNYRSFFINPPTDTKFVNVFNDAVSVASHKFTATVSLNSVINYSSFTFLEGYNVNKVNISLFSSFEDRAHEVHFKGQLPTKYFDLSLFNHTGSTDFTSASDNWVWAIMSDKSVRHPIENIKIYDAYSDFASWVESQDIYNWYSAINLEKLYTKTSFNYIN